MSSPGVENFTILEGATFQRVLRWESPPIVYKTITAVTNSAPVSITATGHGIPNGWRVAITGVKGMTEINSRRTPPTAADYHKATTVDANTFELNGVNSSDYNAYLSGGVVQYNTPVDLTGFTARMDIRANQQSTTPLLQLTTANGRIILNVGDSTITLLIDAPDTEGLSWTQGVYDLELISGDVTPVVTRLLSGTITVSRNVTY